MKTSTGRKMAISTLLTLLVAGSSLTVGSTTVISPTTPQGTTCSTIDNATLADNVRNELAKSFSSRVMGSIQITARRRVVTLRGSTDYYTTRTKMGQLARKVQCVRRVVNRIRYSPQASLCSTGQRNCCCPESGCECQPSNQQCPVCIMKK